MYAVICVDVVWLHGWLAMSLAQLVAGHEIGSVLAAVSLAPWLVEGPSSTALELTSVIGLPCCLGKLAESRGRARRYT